MSKASKGLQWYLQNPKKAKEMEERFGVKPPSIGGKPDSPNWQEQTQHNQTYTDQVIDAARNDYDLRRTTEAAATTGKKKAVDLTEKGFKNIGDVANWMNFNEKAAKRHGQGGDFSSPSDFMGLTNSMVKKENNYWRDLINDAAAGGDATPSELVINPVHDISGIPVKPDLAAAKARVAQHQHDVVSGRYTRDIYDMDAVPYGDDSFLTRYKSRLPKPNKDGTYDRTELNEGLVKGFV